MAIRFFPEFLHKRILHKLQISCMAWGPTRRSHRQLKAEDDQDNCQGDRRNLTCTRHLTVLPTSVAETSCACPSLTSTDQQHGICAMLDRLLHHGHVLKCGPRSWRTKTDLPPQEATG